MSVKETVVQRFVVSAYRALLERDPLREEAARHEKAFNTGLPWLTLLQELKSSDEFHAIASQTTKDVFEEIKRLRPLLVATEADVTIPLEACAEFAKDLCLRGPVRDITVFWHLVHDRGIWQRELTEAIMLLLHPNDVFLDVGANFGYFTVLAASRTVSGSQENGRPTVIGFEPLGAHVEYCRANLRLNKLKNAQIVPYALWNESTIMEIKQDGGLADQMGGAHLVSGATKNQSGSLLVECLTLDGLVDAGQVQIPECRLIKLDIEGAEPFALAGMARTIERTRPLMLVEFNRVCLKRMGQNVSSLWDILHDLDYTMHALPAIGQMSLVEEVVGSTGRAHNLFGRTGLRLFPLSTSEKASELTEALDDACSPSDPIDVLAAPVGFSFPSGD